MIDEKKITEKFSKARKNPFQYIGPLDPFEHIDVCIPRLKEINTVVTGILNGEYWAILGPMQIGKTTFLRQIKYELSSLPCLYIDLEVSPKTENDFYEWLINIITEAFAEDPSTFLGEKKSHLGSDVNFYRFLKSFRTGKDKKIILLFDEIGKAPWVKPFLKIWRKVFNERFDQPELKKYALVISGAGDFVPLTIGPTSPFNIARKMQLTNLTEEESEKIIDTAFNKVGISFEPRVKKMLIDYTSGHPQLLQHACYLSVERSLEKGMISRVDVELAIRELYSESDNLKTLETQIKSDKILENLLKRILSGEKIADMNPEYVTAGVGAVVSDGGYLTIRCKIYRQLIEKLLLEEEDSSFPGQKELFLDLQAEIKEQVNKLDEFENRILQEENRSIIGGYLEEISGLRKSVHKCKATYEEVVKKAGARNEYLLGSINDQLNDMFQRMEDLLFSIAKKDLSLPGKHINRSNLDLFYDIGQIYEKDENFRKAKAVYSRIFEINPSHPGIRQKLRKIEDLMDSMVSIHNAERYERIEEAGRGAMSVVYKAKDSKLDRFIALKILNEKSVRDQNDLEIFISEGRKAAKLKHRNIVTVFDTGKMNSEFFITMEYIEGEPLSKIIKERHPIAIKEILIIAKKLFAALAHSHREGVIHRDVKPRNIMITNRNEVKVVDFGIAALREDLKNEDKYEILGSPWYISPEQIKTETIDHRADIYSAGVTLFQLTCGTVPYDDSSDTKIFIKHLNERLPSIKKYRNDVPEDFIRIIEKCMEKEREERFRDSDIVLEEIEKVHDAHGQSILESTAKLKMFETKK